MPECAVPTLSSTNRVIEECRRYGVDEPTFDEQGGTVVVTFRAPVRPAAARKPEKDQPGTKSGPSRDQVQVLLAARDECSIARLMGLQGRANRTKFRHQVVRPLLEAGWLEMAIPDKPRSSKQRYRTTEAGKRVLAAAEREESGEDG